MPYAKLHSSILLSTVWLENHETLRVWVALMAMADSEGCVEGSIPGLAHTCRVTVEECRAAIDTFLAPDPDSRTQDYEGRRIEEVPGGWRLLNYRLHRDRNDAETRREYERKRKRVYREKANEQADVPDVPDVPDLSRTPRDKSRMSPKAEAEAEAEAEEDDVEGGDGGEDADLQERLARAAALRTRESVGAAGLEAESTVRARFVELDTIRRTVEGEEGVEIGWLSQQRDAVDGLARAVKERGWREVQQVVEHAARLAAHGSTPTHYWRRMFVGDGFLAALDRWRAASKADGDAQRVADVDVEAEVRAQAERDGYSPAGVEQLVANLARGKQA